MQILNGSRNFVNELYCLPKIFQTRTSTPTQLRLLFESLTEFPEIPLFSSQNFRRMLFDVAEVQFVTKCDLREIVKILWHQNNRKNSLKVVIQTVSLIDKHLLIQFVIPDEFVFVLRDDHRAESLMGFDVVVDVVEGKLKEVDVIVWNDETILDEEFRIVVGAVVDEDLVEFLDGFVGEQLI